MLQRARWRHVAAAAIACTAFPIGLAIPFASQWSLYQDLRTTSAIVFGVVGAWLAFVYPQALSGSNEGPSSRVAMRVKRLFDALKMSTIVLVAVLVLGLANAAARTLPAAVAHHSLARGVGFSLLVYLTLLQLWAILLTVLPAKWLSDDLAKAQVERRSRDNLISHPKSKKQ